MAYSEDRGFLTYSKALEGYNNSRNTLQTAFESLVEEKTSTIKDDVLPCQS